MRKLYFLIFCLNITGAAFSQCNHSISLQKTVIESGLEKSGVLEVSVTTSDNYVCVLSVEKGSGPQKVDEKKGQGNSVIRFKGIDINNIYQVQIEFLSDNTPCRKLQKSQIIFEAE